MKIFHWLRGEGFGLIIEDGLRLPAEIGVIVEGFRLLPHLVKPPLADPATQSGCCRRLSSAGPRSTATAGRSRARPSDQDLARRNRRSEEELS